MKQHAASSTMAEDRRLALKIATVMRIGTIIASALLVAGAAFAQVLPGPTATMLLTSGCALIVLLPVIRLAMMAKHFVRLANNGFVVVTVAVLALVLAGGAMGIVH